MATVTNENRDFGDFVAAEGQYPLKEAILLEGVPPNLTNGTSISLVSVKYKEYNSHQNSSSGESVSISATEHVGENVPNVRPFSSSETLVEDSTDDTTDNEKLQAPQLQQTQEPPLSPTIQKEPLSPDGSLSILGSPTQTSPSLKTPLNSGNGVVPTAIEGKDEGPFTFFNSGKAKKKKQNITKTSSSFVAKIVIHDNLAKILANRQNEETYLFYNIGRTFCWTDLINYPKEPLTSVTFTKAFPVCHDVNLLTRSCEHLDVIIGFSTGDGIINNSPVTMVKWMPGSENLFMASYQDGSIVLYDKEKDDQSFTLNVGPDDDGFRVTRPSKTTKHNPTSHWQVSKKTVTAFAFSPDLQHVAVVSIDGCLRIVDFIQEKLYDTYTSYFGGLLCVCWSPDGKYVLTGGQDDLVTIWSFRDQRIVARCQGHQSWVTGVAFDPWRCDEQNYRFGSVAEDTKLLLWDFSVNALHKPKSSNSHRRASLASQSAVTTASLRRNLVEPKNTIHPCLPRSQVAILQPVMSKSIDPDPLCSITFREDSIITTCRKGHIKIWGRPT
ncbi:8175_t:CDS:2 [Ambispora leptoticha]|uniref:8175_t:CDS:1 n=1 Tax=Ambispora leptoticha TaxID=144679 RepID=A0A9N9F0E1_9GLOM|nr:8175_t:CDS:2 [Ambispora leptoticha]